MKKITTKAFGGLVITRKVGSVIAVNGGELLIQITQIRGNEVKLVFLADREKYKVGRLESEATDLLQMLKNFHPEEEA